MKKAFLLPASLLFFSCAKKEEQMGPIAGFNVADFMKAQKLKPIGISTAAPTPSVKAAQMPSGSDDGLRLPDDLLALPNESQLRSYSPTQQGESSVITRPPKN